MLSRTLPKYRNIIPPIPSKQGIRYLQKLADLKGMINYINAENPNILPSHHTTPKLLLNITTNPELWTKQEYRTIPTTIFLIQLLLGKDWEHTNRAKGKELMQIISKRPAFTPYEYWYLLERIVYLPETIKDKPSSCRELFDMCIDMQDYPDNGSFTQHGEQHISEKNNKCFHGVALTTFSSSLNIQKYGIDPDRLSVHGDFQQGQDGGFYLSPSITFAMMFARRVADNMDPPIHTTGVAVKLSLEAFSYSELLNPTWTTRPTHRLGKGAG